MTSPTVVWTEIAVTNLPAAMDFYTEVFKWDMVLDESGPNPLAFFARDEDGSVGGHLYPGTPSETGNTIHLAVPDSLEDAMARCWKAGGKVHEHVIEIPFGRFAYAHDPDGNSIGLFEAKAA